MRINIDESITAQLQAGYYDVFVVGGFYIKADKGFGLRVGNASHEIAVEKNFFKVRAFKNWRRAVKYFRFKIEFSGEYYISARNAEDLEIGKSQLMLRRLFQKPISRDKIELIIEHR